MKIFSTLFLLSAIAVTSTLQAQFTSSIDPSFNSVDSGEEALGSTNLASFSPTAVSAILPLPNGQLVVGTGSHYNQQLTDGLGLIDANGAYVSGFAKMPGQLSRVVWALARQTDGKVVAAGNFETYPAGVYNRFNLCRYLANGSYDDGFNTASHEIAGAINKILLLPNDKLLIAGSFTSFNGNTVGRIVLLNADGSIDNSFNAGTGANNTINDMLLLPDGKIIIAGSFTNYNNQVTAVNRIARLHADGSLDAGFVSNPGANNVINSLQLLPNGQIMVAGDFTSMQGNAINRIAKLNAIGSHDASWSSTSLANAAVYKILAMSDGSFFVAGQFTSFNGTARPGHVHISAAGQIVPGYTIEPNGSTSGSIAQMLEQPNGKVVVAGSFQFLQRANFGGIARLSSLGNIDAGFNPNGGAGSYLNRYIAAMERSADGRIIIGGLFSKYNGVACFNIMRLLANGAVDPSFEPGNEGPVSQVQALAVQPDNKIIIAGGFLRVDGVATTGFARLLENGRIDPAFVPGVINPSTSASGIWIIKVLTDGNILVGGDFSRFGSNLDLRRIARLLANGQPDPAFTPPVISSGRVNAILPLANGQILVGGQSLQLTGQSGYRNLFRLNSDGSLDNSFNAGNEGLDPNNFTDVKGLSQTANSQVLVWGDFTKYNGSNNMGIIKINADGSPVFPHPYAAMATRFPNVKNVVELPNGRLLLAGDLNYFAPGIGSYKGMIQLNANGSVNGNFRVGTGFDFTPYSGSDDAAIVEKAILLNDKLLVAGDFTLFNGVKRNRIAMVNLGDVVTPVNWLSFTASAQTSGALLQWSTATEQQNSGFYVECSNDGLHFNQLGFVSAAGNGNNSYVNHYHFTHANPLEGVNYYRLRQVDKDGEMNYSKIIKLSWSSSHADDLQVWPTMANSQIQILVSASLQKPGMLQVIDATGRIVLHKQAKNGSQFINISALPGGKYLVRFSDGAAHLMGYFIKQ